MRVLNAEKAKLEATTQWPSNEYIHIDFQGSRESLIGTKHRLPTAAQPLVPGCLTKLGAREAPKTRSTFRFIEADPLLLVRLDPVFSGLVFVYE